MQDGKSIILTPFEMVTTENLHETKINDDIVDNIDEQLQRDETTVKMKDCSQIDSNIDRIEPKKGRMSANTSSKKEETYIFLLAVRKYACNNATGNKSQQVKRWKAVLKEFNELNKAGTFCKQTRTLKNRYEKLVALYLQKNTVGLLKLMHEKDIPLLHDIIANTFADISDEEVIKNHDIEDKIDAEEDNDEDVPLDSIKILPRSSYLYQKQADAQTTETASPTTTSTSHSFMSPRSNHNSKKLSILYGAAMLEEDNNNNANMLNTGYNTSRDLEIQQLKESIVDIKNNILNLEKIFDRLNKKVDDLMRQ